MRRCSLSPLGLALLAGVLALATLAVPGTPAHAQEASASQRSLARQLFEEGVEHLQAGRAEEAREAFQQAYDLVPNPAILMNLATAQVQSGRLVEGAETYRQFLREVTSGPLAAHRESAEGALADVEARIPRLSLVIPGLQDSDVVKLDDEPLIHAVLANELPVSPGAHVIVVEREGRQWANQEFSLAEREMRQLTVRLEDPGPLPDPDCPEPPCVAEPAPPDNPCEVNPLAPECTTDTGGGGDDNLLLYIGGGVGAAVVIGVLVGVLVATSGGGGTKDPFQDGNWGVLTVP